MGMSLRHKGMLYGYVTKDVRICYMDMSSKLFSIVKVICSPLL